MPKIIENLQNRLLQEARAQVEESGYSAMTIRSVAEKCGVGVGTVYNYYSSKEALVASFMLEDWQQCVKAVHAAGEQYDQPTPVIRAIYDQLQLFTAKYSGLFHDAAAVTGFAGSFGKYHGVLRAQLAHPLRRFCTDDFTAQFIAESLLTWTMAGEDFDTIHNLIVKLF